MGWWGCACPAPNGGLGGFGRRTRFFGTCLANWSDKAKGVTNALPPWSEVEDSGAVAVELVEFAFVDEIVVPVPQ